MSVNLLSPEDTSYEGDWGMETESMTEAKETEEDCINIEDILGSPTLTRRLKARARSE